MLAKIGVLTDAELQAAEKEMKNIFAEFGETMALSVTDEDIHSKLENMLTERVGEVGKKIHTGRSRNDQVLTVMRLYERDSMLQIGERYADYLRALIALFGREGKKILPGYTHTKQAMLTTAGMWIGAFVETGLNNLRYLRNVFDLIDANPLGSGSGFGVPIALDREMTAKLLGFGRVLENPIAVQNSRGKDEGSIIDAYWNMMADFSRMAADMLFYYSDELMYLEADVSVTTGSSIMPQKRNLDVMELVRAKAHTMLGYSNTVKSIVTGLVSGYNRDYQETKEPLMKATDLIEDTIEAVIVTVESVRFSEPAVKKLLSKGIFATDMAYDLSRKGMPFRDAYKAAAKGIDAIEVNDELIRMSIENRVSLGSPITIDPAKWERELKAAEKSFDDLREKNGKISELLK